MGKNGLLYVIATLIFVAADFVWLGFIAKTFYNESLGHLMLEKPVISVALVFYLLYPAGLLIFATVPAYEADSLRDALLFGALFGFFAYATYDLSNLATLRGVPVSFAIVDIAWGTFASGVTSAAALLITRMILR